MKIEEIKTEDLINAYEQIESFIDFLKKEQEK